MVTYTDKVVLELEAKLDRYNRDVLAGQRRFDEAMRRMGRGARNAESRVTASLSRMAARATAAVAAIYALGQALTSANRYADAYIEVENRLRAIGETSDEAAEKLLAAAIRSRTGIEDMSTAVLRFEKATGDGFDVAIRRVETLNKLLAVGGATTAEVNSVMQQLGQALTSGTLQGDELRSLRENAPVEVLDALARAAGTTRSELKKFGEEGRLTSEIVTAALDDLAAEADAKFGQVETTFSGAITNMTSALTVFIGRTNEGLGATDRLTEGVSNLAGWLTDNVDEAEEFGRSLQAALTVANEYITSAHDALIGFAEQIHAVTDDVFGIGEAFAEGGLTMTDVLLNVMDALGTFAGIMEGSAAAARTMFLNIADSISAGFQGAINAVIRAVSTMLQKMTSGINKLIEGMNKIPGVDIGPIKFSGLKGIDSIATNLGGDVAAAYAEGFDRAKGQVQSAANDMIGTVQGALDGVVDRYRAVRERLAAENRAAEEAGTPGGDGGAGGGTPPSTGTGAGGGGGRRRTGRGRGGFSIAEEIQELQQKAAALRAEGEALAALNPLSEDYELRVAAIRKENELLLRAQKEGVELTPAVRASIAEMAGAYAEAETQLKDLQDSQKDLIQSAEEWRDLERDTMQGFISDLIAGKSASEALADALQKVADKLLDVAFDRLFEGGSGGGGFFGGVLSGLGNWLSGLGGRASGGSVQAGQPYVINENTPNSELFIPSKSGAVLNVPQAQQALQRAVQASSRFGDAGSVATPQPVVITSSSHFSYSLDGANGDQQIREIVESSIRQAAPIIQGQAVSEATRAVGQMSRRGSKSYLGIR